MYMFLHVSPCPCVFGLSYVFVYGEDCVQAKLKVFLFASNQINTRGKSCVSQVEGVQIYFESNAYSYKRFCF